MVLASASFWSSYSEGKQSSRWLSGCFMPVVVQRQEPGWAELESLFMRQSTVAFERISSISGSRSSYLAVTRPVLRCCVWNTEK